MWRQPWLVFWAGAFYQLLQLMDVATTLGGGCIADPVLVRVCLMATADIIADLRLITAVAIMLGSAILAAPAGPYRVASVSPIADTKAEPPGLAGGNLV